MPTWQDLEFRASQEKSRTKRRVRKQKGESIWRVQQRTLAKALGPCQGQFTDEAPYRLSLARPLVPWQESSANPSSLIPSSVLPLREREEDEEVGEEDKEDEEDNQNEEGQERASTMAKAWLVQKLLLMLFKK